MVSLWGASSLIRSVQAGTIAVGAGTTSQTATIAAVDLANTMLLFSITSQAGTFSDPRNAWARLELTNSTTLTASINADAGYSTTVGYRVVEYRPGVFRSIQYSTITMASGAASGTVTITEVDPAKSFVMYLGHTEDSAAASPGMDPNGQWCRLAVTNGTTITAARNTAVAANNVVGVVIGELF